MTLRETLKNDLKKYYRQAPKKMWNQHNLEMNWSDEEKLYIGTDVKGKEWIAALQHTTVPIFSVPCPNKEERKNETEIICGAINFVAICNDDDDILCRKCNKTFTPKLNIPESSQAFKLLGRLDK